MCLTPSSIKDNSGKWVPIPCGTCAECIEWKRYQWYIRIKKELLFYKTGYFITLTYSDDNLVYGSTEPTLVKSDLQLYLKRFRKKYKAEFKYYSVGEYGTLFKRPHYHFIIIADSFENLEKNLISSWNKGFIKIDKICDANIKYILKYHVLKTEYPEGSAPSFAQMSKGLGLRYCESVKRHYNNGKTSEVLEKSGVYIDGKKKPLPRYFKEKIYSKTRQKLISKYNQNKALEKEVEHEVDSSNYWSNKLSEIRAKNDLIKLKNKRGNKL